MTYDSSNPFLNGNYAPWREEGDEFDLLVEGEIPKELSGTLYRIGPNPHYPPRGRYHWFDGDGMIHGFTLRDGKAFTGLTKRDYQKNSSETFSLGSNTNPGEPVFVARAHKSGELDGWVLSVWYDGNSNRSELVIQDAANFTSKPVARVKLSHRVPFGFHGNWVQTQIGRAHV